MCPKATRYVVYSTSQHSVKHRTESLVEARGLASTYPAGTVLIMWGYTDPEIDSWDRPSQRRASVETRDISEMETAR